MVLFHLFEYIIIEQEYYRTTFNHSMEYGALLLHAQSNFTVGPSDRPAIVRLECHTDYYMVVGYVFASEKCVIKFVVVIHREE